MDEEFPRKLHLQGKLLLVYVRSNWRLFATGLCLGLLAFYFLPRAPEIVFPKRPETIGIAGNYTIATLPLDVQREISFGLTNLLADGEATSAAALSWQATDSGKTVVFKLDGNLFWQDGTKFDASQINYNLKGVSVKPLSLDRVQFSLKEPFAPLLAVVSQPLFKNGLTGLERYRVESIKFNGRFIGSISLLDHGSGARKVYKFYPDEAEVVSALRLGAVNKIAMVHRVTGFDKDRRYSVVSSQKTNTMAMIFFNNRSKVLEEKQVRQGLVYALPDQFSEGTSAISPIPPTSWAYNSNIKDYTQNLDTAGKMLTKVGSGSATLRIKLYTDRNLSEVGRMVSDSWSKAGVTTDVIVTDVIPNYFDAYLAYVEIPPDPDQYSLWHSTQAGNIGGYKSPKVDRLLEDGRKELDQAVRKQIYFNFQKAISEDVPAAFLFFPNTYMIQRR